MKAGTTESVSMFISNNDWYVRHVYWDAIEDGRVLRHTSFYPVANEKAAIFLANTIEQARQIQLTT